MSPWILMLLAQTGGEPADTTPEVEPLSDVGQPPLTDATVETPSVEPSVTLAQLLDAAERQNVDRRITFEQHRRADAELRQAWTALLPGLSVLSGWTHNQYPVQFNGLNLTPEDQLDLSARVDLPLIDTSKWLRASAASSAQDGASARNRLTADQVKRAVTAGWYAYAGALALEVSARRSVSVAEAQLKLQEIRFRNGTVPELDLFRGRAEVERNRQVVADTVRLIAISRRNLQSLTSVDPGVAARLPEVDLRPAPPLAELEANVGELPAVQAAERDLDGADKLALANKLALVPVIGAQFTERISNASGFNGQNASYIFGVNLSWRIDAPIFMAMQVGAAQAAVGALLVEKARMQARDQINADWQSLAAAISKVSAVRAQVESAQKARNVAATRYEVGASTQIEVIQADRDLFAAEAQQIQAQSDLASARVALQISAGLAVEAP